MNNLRILLYMMLLSLAACHPEGTSVKQGLDKAAQLMEQDPDTASIILETIQSSQMNEAQLAEYNLLCTQLNEDKNIPHSSDKQIRQAASERSIIYNKIRRLFITLFLSLQRIDWICKYKK